MNALEMKSSSSRLPSLPVIAFIASLAVPFLFQVGPILLTVNRIAILLMLIPCLIMWLIGRAGSVRLADLILLLLCVWVALSLTVIHGIDVGFKTGGIYFVETFGSFLIARCYVRSADNFRAAIHLIFWLVCAMLPFAIFEAITGRNLLLDAANSIWFSGNDAIKDPRWGLDRVEGVMLHPILFGVFCGSALSLTYWILGYQVKAWKRLGGTTLVGITAFLSLSAGPFAAMLLQILLTSWDRLLSAFQARWKLLTGGFASAVLAIEVVANRSSPEIFISYFAFNTHNALNRVRIWTFGSESVANNPLFGVGLNEWDRPYWMSGSMDMFWLSRAVRNGLPAGLLLHLFFFVIFIGLARKTGLSQRVSQYRKGLLICLASLYIVGWTVDFWKVLYTYFVFLLASGIWILDEPSQTAEQSEHLHKRA